MAAHVMEGPCETYTDERWVEMCTAAAKKKKNYKKSVQVAKKNIRV